MTRKIARLLIDVAALVLAIFVCTVAFKSHIAGIVGAGVVAVYGMWCFFDGISTRRAIVRAAAALTPSMESKE